MAVGATSPSVAVAVAVASLVASPSVEAFTSAAAAAASSVVVDGSISLVSLACCSSFFKDSLESEVKILETLLTLSLIAIFE